ncbi:MAG: hypothetical protein ACJAVP_003056, partial [Spirosomataceae bacterium]
MKKISNHFRIAVLLAVMPLLLHAQETTELKINPTNWYVGMKNPNIQLLVYGDKVGNGRVKLKEYGGVKITRISTVENPNYVFIDLVISPNAKAGNLHLDINHDGKTTSFDYELANRTAKPQAVTPADFIYLLMPDRFSSGDPTNDKFADMADSTHDRNNPWKRHGGDLQGITNHLNYFTELGVTALWLNPVVENNQPLTDEGGQMRSAYHGYGFTDHYNVDKRLGGNEAYKKLVDEAHKKGIKVIQDAV